MRCEDGVSDAPHPAMAKFKTRKRAKRAIRNLLEVTDNDGNAMISPNLQFWIKKTYSN
jgi:hypothetical protein